MKDKQTAQEFCMENKIDFEYLCVVFCGGVISCFVKRFRKQLNFLSDNDRNSRFSSSRTLYHGLELLREDKLQ